MSSETIVLDHPMDIVVDGHKIGVVSTLTAAIRANAGDSITVIGAPRSFKFEEFVADYESLEEHPDAELKRQIDRVTLSEIQLAYATGRYRG